MDYIFMTDVSADIPAQMASDLHVEVIPMDIQLGDKTYLHYADARMLSLEEFYAEVKKGTEVKTTQINYDNFTRYFERYLKAGKDVIYTGISTGLSGTFNTCQIAVNDLQEKYPDRKIYVIDSKCDSAGLAYLVYHAGQKYNEGATIDELKEFIEEFRNKVGHWFIVDDLDQLKRGGRISAVTATFGKALQIKPLLSCDENGKLVNSGKIRGGNNIIPTLIKMFNRDAEDAKNHTVFVAHADNLSGAEELRKKIKGQCKEVKICDIGPVIGAHVGSGMLAIIFYGERNYKV